MRALDTNVLVRLIVRDEPLQTASAEAFVESGAWVSLVALVETIWVLKSTYGLPRSLPPLRVCWIMTASFCRSRLL